MADSGPVTKSPPPADSRCELCGQPQPLTFHHLIPRRVHGRRRIRERHAPSVLRNAGLWLCRGCHSFIHEQFDEAELAERLHTREALMAEPAVARHVAWAARQRRAGPAP